VIDLLVSLLARIVTSSRRPDLTLAVIAAMLAWLVVTLLRFVFG
jgi:hypothetical protein